MNLRAHSILQQELRTLRGFYHATVDSYAQTEALLDFRGKFRDEFAGLVRDNQLDWIKSEHFSRKKSFHNKTHKVLREVVLVRMISALETYLIDVIRDIFLISKIPFRDKAVRLDFSQEELIAINNPTQIYNRIINRETRKLTNSGFVDVVKYYKNRFNIDLGSIPPGASVLKEYHERRHILVHRLGNTDFAYREKHKTDVRRLSVSKEYVEKLFIDITEFTDKLATQIIGYLETLESDAYKDSRTRYIVNIEFLGDKVPICLQKDFQFWADDEFIVLGDILQEAEVLPDRKMRYYFSAKSHAITRLKKHLRKEQKRNTISVQPISDVSTGGKPCKLTPDIVKQIQEALPSQPWPTAIHKVVASKLGLSNSAVSSAINLLIDEGVFHDQRDGVIIE